ARVDRPGLYCRDRLLDVLGREASGEHDPALGLASTLEVRRVLLLPRPVDDARHLAAFAKQDAVASPVAVLAPVELDEVGLLSDLAHVHGDRERSEERRVGKECRSRWSSHT